MAFWLRINHSKLKLLSQQFRRCYYVQTPFAPLPHYTVKPSNSRTLENPIRDICNKPTDFCNSARFFATSYQAKTKKEDKDSGGPRLNQEITAQFVRLVTDEGHRVVPLCEALKQARNLKVDLVEVQRNVDPPVCKLMDFHKERYQKHMKEKDRAKSKSEVTLRKGDCKEVRFSDKTEQKDLRMKADTVIRLMQRGYRVKCMVTGSRKKGSGGASFKKGYGDEGLTEEEIAEKRRQEEEEEKEELKALLSGLIALIEDECFVETGPRVEKKQAYVIVRHVKFGPSKKGSAKKLKDVEKAASAQPTAGHSGPIGSVMMEEDPAGSDTETEDEILFGEDDLPGKEFKDDKPARSVDHSDDDFDRVFDLSSDNKEPSINCTEEMNGLPEADSPQMSLKKPNLSHLRPALPEADSSQVNYKVQNLHPRPAHDAKQEYKPSSSPQPSPAIENRYKRNGPMERFSANTTRDNRGPDKIGSFRFEPQLPRQRGNTQSQINVTSSVGERNPIWTDSSAFRNIKPPPVETLKHPNPPSAAGTKASSYGIFSSLKATTSGEQGAAAEANNNAERNSYNSGNNSGTGGFGANPRFSNSKPDDGSRQGRMGNIQ